MEYSNPICRVRCLIQADDQMNDRSYSSHLSFLLDYAQMGSSQAYKFYLNVSQTEEETRTLRLNKTYYCAALTY